jgi:hypothetical protein
MNPFMPAILLRLTGLDPLELDTQLEPFDRQAAEATSTDSSRTTRW